MAANSSSLNFVSVLARSAIEKQKSRRAQQEKNERGKNEETSTSTPQSHCRSFLGSRDAGYDAMPGDKASADSHFKQEFEINCEYWYQIKEFESFPC